jgi:hypothetical protein
VYDLDVTNAVAVQRLVVCLKAKVKQKKWYCTSKAMLTAVKKMAE